LTPEERRAQLEALRALEAQILAENPLEGFHACEKFCGAPACPKPDPERNPTGGRPKQHEFMVAPEFIVASNAGNRFGKTTAMVVWAIIQHTPLEMLPDRLKGFKRTESKIVQGRYMLPTEDLLEDSVLPVFKQWTPPSILKGGAWEKAYRKAPGNTITFADGSKLAFYTYKQDAAVLAGWSGDYVLWDEPPPESHWREGGPIRVMDRQGCHRFGMTPVNMVGGGIGWIKRRIFDRGRPDSPQYNPRIKIVKASIWDNPDFSAKEIEETLDEYPADERQAREFGDFIHFGGMCYPGGFERVLRGPVTAQEVKRMDVVVGVDPGLKNAAFVWVAFDNENRAVVFDEVLLKESTPKDYVDAIRTTNARWGIKELQYVIDGSAANRPTSGVGESVEALLMQHGLYFTHADRSAGAVQAGVQQIRDRIAQGAFHIVEGCTGLRGEADEYRMEDRDDGEFKVVKENDHRLDALRYAVMERLWYRGEKPGTAKWNYADPTFEPPYNPYVLAGEPEYGPMGPWS
jgi:hypothetical protein